MKRILIAAIAGSLMTILSASVPSHAQYVPSYGSPATGAIPDRVIRITDTTKHVNVIQREVVRFVLRDANGQDASFDWGFYTNETRSFPLAEIAPSGLLGNRSIRVYIARAHDGG